MEEFSWLVCVFVPSWLIKPCGYFSRNLHWPSLRAESKGFTCRTDTFHSVSMYLMYWCFFDLFFWLYSLYSGHLLLIWTSVFKWLFTGYQMLHLSCLRMLAFYFLFPCHISIIHSASFFVSLYCAVILFPHNSECICGVHIPIYCTVCLLHNVLSLHLCPEHVILYLDNILTQIVFLMHQFFHFQLLLLC